MFLSIYLYSFFFFLIYNILFEFVCKDILLLISINVAARYQLNSKEYY